MITWQGNAAGAKARIASAVHRIRFMTSSSRYGLLTEGAGCRFPQKGRLFAPGRLAREKKTSGSLQAAVLSNKVRASGGSGGLVVLPFKLVMPSLPRGSGRSRPRFPARGLTLTCTRPSPYRFHTAVRNLAVELKDVGWGGVRFVAAEPMQVPCSVDLQIRDDASGASLQTRGVTRWTQTRKENGRDLHLAGARFDMILTPPADAAWYFEGRVGPQVKPWQVPAAKPPPKPRLTARFTIPGCDVVLERDFRFRGSAKPGNLASRLLDFSRSGAQVLCKDPVVRGE